MPLMNVVMMIILRKRIEMPRISPVHYIAPSSVSITPNCNGSVNDLAVYVARGAKIKVFSRNAGILTENSEYQEWTLKGRNRRKQVLSNDQAGGAPIRP